MGVFGLLFDDWVGILSLFTIVFVIGMAIFFVTAYLKRS